MSMSKELAHDTHAHTFYSFSLRMRPRLEKSVIFKELDKLQRRYIARDDLTKALVADHKKMPKVIGHRSQQTLRNLLIPGI